MSTFNLPNDFYWITYLKLNNDLINNIKTKQKAIEHYLKYGISENRQYKYNKIPDDFNWKDYLELNSDLVKLTTKEQAINHYINHGIKENRIYKIDYSILPSDFDWKTYIKLNSDLSQIYNENIAKKHYVMFGKNEKRIYKITNNEITNNEITNNEITNNEITNNEIINIKTIIHHDNNPYNFIKESDILQTKQFLKDNPNFLKQIINTDILKSILSFILIVDFNNGGGGTTIFLNRIVSKYKNFNTFLILRFDGTNYHLNLNEEYLISDKLSFTDITEIIEIYKSKINKIFINHLIGFDEKFIKYIFDLNICKIGITHDFYNIFDNPQPDFQNFNITNRNLFININKYDFLITQNIINVNVFSNYYKNKMDVVELPDFKYTKEKIYSNNNMKNCCLIGNINVIKGSDIFENIINHFSINYPDVCFYVIGNIKCNNFKNYKTYNTIEEFNNILYEYKPNIVIELSIWPETYSYTLTMGMLTNLPILYLKKPTETVVENRLLNYRKAYKFENNDELYKLICRYSQNWFYTIKPIISYSKYWDDLFISRKEKLITNNKKIFKYGIKPYFIYFPQFHEFIENNINFYDKFTDMKNLKLFNKNEIIKNEIPSKNYCEIDMYDYNLNSSLIQKQIELINHYGFAGLAIYYYWFSTNDFTKQNMIMEKVIDKFFDSNINMYDQKIFFIWANEDWTNNIALDPKLNNKKEITNQYNYENFKKNINNLINYFKNKNYLKLDNKPVFFIYHTHLIKNINFFYNLLNRSCIDNGFEGVHLVLNSFNTTYDNFKNFYINFNYKLYDCRFFDKNDNQIKLNYKKYMDDNYHFCNNKIQTVVFNFDNRARLFKPNNLKNSTVCINNSELNKIVFTRKIIELYKDSKTELDKIMLINSLNEWGENMAFEPSDKYGYYNINLLTNLLKN